jgi:TraX protein
LGNRQSGGAVAVRREALTVCDGDVKARGEVAKWAGLVAMVVDHVWRFLGVPVPGAAIVGRFAFPCFVAAFALQAVGPRADRAAARAVIAGLAIAPAYVVVVGGWWLDVLVTLGLGLQAWVCLGWRGWGRVVAVLLCAAGATVAEYGIAGFLFVLASCALRTSPGVGSRQEWLAVFSCSVAGLYVAGGGIGFLIGVLLAAVLVDEGPMLARVRVFYPAYMLQWPVLIGLRLLGV